MGGTPPDDAMLLAECFQLAKSIPVWVDAPRHSMKDIR
jgi:hypothetical protein